MQTCTDDIIRVHAQWNGWQSVEVRFADIARLHWFRPSSAPQAIVHGYIPCSKIIAGNIAHACDRLSAPHQLLICILKRHACPSVYSKLAQLADAASGAAIPSRTTEVMRPA
jgi:hypothetical protein